MKKYKVHYFAPPDLLMESPDGDLYKVAEADAEIDRLTADNQRYREALEIISLRTEDKHFPFRALDAYMMAQIARKALTERQKG